ncbi:MAG TPA: YhdP family protein [Burkholderiaceae bacterium]
MSRTSPSLSDPTDPPAAAAAWRPTLTAVLLRRLLWVVRSLLGLLVLAWSLLLIAWLTLHWGILPHIQQWREPIETQASKALGLPVRIGNIAVRSSGWVPSFELREVTLLDAEQRPALRLPRVFAAISPRSLLSFEPRFAQLLIDGAELDIRRDAQGRIWIAGLDVSGTDRDSGGGSAAADWFFKQGEFVIRGGALRWTDEQRQAAPLVLRDLQLVVRNGLRSHHVRLDATPPPEWGERFSASGRFSQSLLARSGDWRHWSGQAHVDLPRADVRELRRYVTLPFELDEGDGAVRGWFDMKEGRPQAATVDIALRAVSLRLAANLEPLKVEEIEGRLIAQRTKDELSLEARQLGFLIDHGASAERMRWPRGDMRLVLRQLDGSEAVAGGSFEADKLDVGQMARIAASIPLGDAVRRLLAEVQPQGTISQLATRWDGPLDAPQHYAVKAQFNGVTLASHASDQPGAVGRPGLRNATLQLAATEAGGQAQLGIQSGALELPGVFDEPVLPLDNFTAQVTWKIEAAPVAQSRGAIATSGPAAPPKISVQVSDARFANTDVQGEFKAGWSTGTRDAAAGESKGARAAGAAGAASAPHAGPGARFPGRLDLEGRLTSAEAARIARYLPLGIPQHTREYVQHAVRGGKVSGATFKVKGDLAEFPFSNAKQATKDGSEGEFRIAATVEDVAFAFVPSQPASGSQPAYSSPWPTLTQVGGELVFDRASMEIRNARAQLGAVEWSKIQGGIKNLEHGVLTLDATARGPLAEMLKAVNASPIGGWINKALDKSTGSGAAEMKLGLSIPLEQPDQTVVKGSLLLAGNDVRIVPDSPTLLAAKGRVDFSQKGFAVVGASARVLGGDLSFGGGTQADGSVRFEGQGTLSADGLRRAADLGPAARAAAFLQGQAAYRMTLGFARGEPEINVTSNLVGLAINLPQPLNKTADATLPLRFQTTLDPAAGAAGQPPRDTLRVDLGNIVQALYQRELGSDGPRVLRGGIGVNEQPALPASGVAANLNLKSVNTDEWEAVRDKLGGTDSSGSNADSRDAAPASRSPYEPDTIALRAQEFVTGQRKLTKLVAGISNEGNLWRANLDADQLSGYVEYRAPMRRGGTGAGRVHARFARLSLPKSDVEQVENLLDQQQSTTIPGLDIVIDDFELRGKHLGKLEIEAVNRSSGPRADGQREWQLTKLNLTTPEAQLAATGNWAAIGGRGSARRAVMDFKLQLADSGALLDRLGTSKAIRGGKGQLSGQISWTGSPFAIDYPSLAGQVNVAIDAGQFLKAEPGAARLLGVLNLQSLPRRLTLDFRDVFQEGFAFDNVTGDVAIAQGVAKTNNLRMRGVQALVLMEGSADIARETQDLRVVVVPEINAGTAALAYAVINPAIGLGAFLAQTILRKPLMEASTREFHVSGSWADPKVEQVHRKLGEDASAAESAASAPKKP